MENNNLDKSRRVFLKSLLTGSALVIAEGLGGGLISKVFAQEGGAVSYDLPVYLGKHPAGIGFPQSVAAGDPSPTGAILWTRVDPGTGVPGLDGTSFDPALVQWLEKGATPPNDRIREAIDRGQFLMVEVAEEPSFQQVTLRSYTPIWKNFDHVVKVDLDGHLDSQKTYYYRFITQQGHVSQTGRFKTLPPYGGSLTSVKFGYLSCQDYTNGYFHAHRYLAEEELDFVVHLGDYIYEAVEYGSVKERKINLPSGSNHAHTMEDYRHLYRTMKADNNLQQLHERHAMISTWDDHEFANDAFYPAVAPDDRTNSDPQRRMIANQAWFEYTPARVQFDANKDFTAFKIYRSIQVGNLMELILTDERLYRDAPPCGMQTGDKFFAPGCEKMFDPKRSMLGHRITTQRDWMMDRLKNSPNLWKVWANGVQFTPLKILGRYMNLDAWDGYSGERDYITRELKKAGIKNWITITGDLHSYEASLIQEDYEKDADREAVGVEFMIGSVSSANFDEMVVKQITTLGGLIGVSSQDGTGRKPSSKTTQPNSNSNPIPEAAMRKLLHELKVEEEIARLKDKMGANRPLPPEEQQRIFGKIHDYIKNKVMGAIQSANPWIKLFNSSTYGYGVMELTHQKATWSAYSVKDIKSKHRQGKGLLFQVEVPRDQAKLEIVKS